MMKMSPHEQTAAFAALSEILDRHSRRRLREALEVPTTDELSQQDLFALARAEIQAPSDAEKRRPRKEGAGTPRAALKGSNRRVPVSGVEGGAHGVGAHGAVPQR